MFQKPNDPTESRLQVKSPDISRLRRSKILIVDDDENFLSEFQDLMKDYGCNIRLASDGESCLKIAQIERPNLILLDIAMPKLDGFDVIRVLQTHSVLKHIPVIVVTAKAFEEDAPKDCRDHIAGFFYKPFDLEELLGKIGTLLSKSDCNN